jgi:hypothetical protein
MRLVKCAAALVAATQVRSCGASEFRGGSAAQRHIASRWDFDGSLDGWAQATWSELGAEVFVEGGELRGRVQRGDVSPRLDSPMMSLVVDDDYVVAMRIKRSGGLAARGAVSARLLHWSAEQSDAQSLPRTFGEGPTTVVTVPFDRSVGGDGRYAIVFAPLSEVIRGTSIVQLRVHPVSVPADAAAAGEAGARGVAAAAGFEPWSTFAIDWIALVKRPSIDKVEGCVQKYFDSRPLPSSVGLERRAEDGVFVLRAAVNGSNLFVARSVATNEDGLLATAVEWQAADPLRRYSTTYNCPRDGRGWRLRVTGRNFGDYSGAGGAGASAPWDSVTIDGQPCLDVVEVEPQSVLECTLPSARADSALDRVLVEVRQPDLRDLRDAQPLLSYAVPPPQPQAPQPSNVAAHSVGLSWRAPALHWDAVTVTGYRVRVLAAADDPQFHAVAGAPRAVDLDDGRSYDEAFAIVVGNVTTTTVTGLRAAHFYKFTIEALAEDQRDPAWLALDLYGRRRALTGALASVASPRTPAVSTLGEDVLFGAFDANATLDAGAVDARSSAGPGRETGGQGHFGLTLVGDAHVAGCNASSACCDWPARVDPAVADPSLCPRMCSGVQTALSSGQPYVGLASGLGATSNTAPPPGGAARRALYVGAFDAALLAAPGAPLPRCGPALRLTGSAARLSGAAWYPRKLNVREGFETRFTMRMANPSLVCSRMDDVHTHCRSRGADGLAFVVQNDDPLALGVGGMALGYGGLADALAVEFDTFHNPENADPYENHVGIMARGRGWPALADHALELGGSPAPVDLADGDVRVRIVYRPGPPRPEDLLSDALQMRTRTAMFLSGDTAGASASWAAQQQGSAELVRDQFGQPVAQRARRDWEEGFGLLSVYINDLDRPLLVTPLNLGATLGLDSGRAWVGFTAATGTQMWQAHEITQWSFSALRDAREPRLEPLQKALE